jgi:uncharacterized protein YegJ (DUF2314 family)
MFAYLMERMHSHAQLCRAKERPQQMLVTAGVRDGGARQHIKLPQIRRRHVGQIGVLENQGQSLISRYGALSGQSDLASKSRTSSTLPLFQWQVLFLQ